MLRNKLLGINKETAENGLKKQNLDSFTFKNIIQ